MKNWSTDTKKLKKNKEKYAIWKLEQMVDFGLDGEKINEKEFLNYLPKLNVDSNRLKFLKILTESLSRKWLIKFDWHIDPIQLGTQFIKSKKAEDLPRMIKNINNKEWQSFFIEEAKKLKRDIFK